MSKIANSEGASESEKPVQNDVVQFPPFPDPKDEDFDDDIGQEERNYYQTLFKDLNDIKNMRLHCTACDGHMGCSARNEVRMRAHPMLRTLVCHNCHIFYNSGEFEKGDDGSELYCRWCGQGGQVYCCSDCPHVFCAKCIKRNMGAPKIKEIENTDDWKCFKCNPRCLWDLRALCWAVLRYCDLKNKITNETQDEELKEAYKKDCAIDYSECCRHKKRNQKIEITKKKEIKKETDAKVAANIISKIPSTIQVKKFAAAVNMDEPVKPDKKPQKRPQSPSKLKSVLVKTPMNITPKAINPISTPPVAKKMRLPNPLLVNTPRLLNANERKAISTYTRIRPKPPQLPIPIGNSSYNGFSVGIYNTAPNDNINLSLESLTQGLDMSAVATVTAISQNFQDDDVVCTPDFPLEPLCEVTEDNDDDVQCITPGPVATPKFVSPSPLIHRPASTVTADVTSDNIIQMTENDVTVNTATGGLKFRVDPQTLSSNKMYRLPDGRIFAINANPNMPGGYSATIVAVTEPAGKTAPKGATYAAKLSSVTTSMPLTPPPKPTRNPPRILKRSTPKTAGARLTKLSESSTRECDLKVPVEWYRYNLIDAVDALEYALSRLNKLKKEATTVHLRTRTLNEMRNLHRTFERLLNTSSNRFGEIRDNLNNGLKQYVLRKSGGNLSEDDDDVEILPDMDDNDDPIFIDENSMESNINCTEHQEVDLTGAGSSEHNDSGENNKDNASKIDADCLLNESQNDSDNIEHSSIIPNIINNNIILHCTDDITEKENLERDETEKHVESEKSFSDNMVNEHTSNNVVEENVMEDILKKNNTEKKLDKTDKESIVNNTTEDIVVQTVNKNEIEQIITEKEIIQNVDSETNISVKDSITDDTEKNNDFVDNDKMEIDTVVNELTHLASLGNEITNNETKADKVNGEMTDSKTNIEKENSGPVRLDNFDSEDSMPQKDLYDKADSQDSDDKMQDTEMSEEMIETLLKDDNIDDPESNVNSMDVPVLQET